LRRSLITTWMLLFKRSQVSILIMNKFNLHRFDNLSIVFAQPMSINIPLLVTKIGHLQGEGQFFLSQRLVASKAKDNSFFCT
jgi:hypothetical protein